MNYLTKIAAALAAAAILLLAPGAQAAIPEDNWGTRGTGTSTTEVGACPEGMMQTFCGHYGLDTTEPVPASGGPGPVVYEPDTTGQIVGWSAASVAAVSAAIAGFIIIRRRRHHGELPHAA